TFFVTDDRSVYPARVAVAGGGGGAVEKLMSPPVVVGSWTFDGGCSAVTSSTDTKPTEIYRATAWKLEPLTHHNDSLVSDLQRGVTEDVSFESRDGVTEVHGYLAKPVGYVAGPKVPTRMPIPRRTPGDES